MLLYGPIISHKEHYSQVLKGVAIIDLNIQTGDQFLNQRNYIGYHFLKTGNQIPSIDSKEGLSIQQ